MILKKDPKSRIVHHPNQSADDFIQEFWLFQEEKKKVT